VQKEIQSTLTYLLIRLLNWRTVCSSGLDDHKGRLTERNHVRPRKTYQMYVRRLYGFIMQMFGIDWPVIIIILKNMVI